MLDLFLTEGAIPRHELEEATGLGRDAVTRRIGKLRQHRLLLSGRGDYRKAARFVAFLCTWAESRSLTRLPWSRRSLCHHIPASPGNPLIGRSDAAIWTVPAESADRDSAPAPAVALDGLGPEATAPGPANQGAMEATTHRPEPLDRVAGAGWPKPLPGLGPQRVGPLRLARPLWGPHVGFLRLRSALPTVHPRSRGRAGPPASPGG